MIDAFRPWVSRVAAVAAATVVVLSGYAMPAAAKSSIPVWGIESIGSSVATRDALTVSGVILDIGYEGPQQITFRFELDGGDNSLRFLGGYSDANCHTVGSAPASVAECVYTRNIVIGQREQFSFRHKTTRPSTSGLPTLWITISISDSFMRRGVQIKGVAPEADLVVAVDGPGAGRVGDIVEFTWTLTNTGLDPVYDRSGVITFVAPPGTQFADSLADTSPDDMICQVSSSVQTRRPCWFAVIHPGQAKARKEKWRLKILSSQVGEGNVEAMLSNFTGKHPEGDYSDPTPGNNVAPIRVQLLTGVAAPGGLPLPSSAEPSAAPSSDPVSGSEPPNAENTADPTAPPLTASSSSAKLGKTLWWTAAAGFALLTALVVSMVLRRRRSGASQQEPTAATPLT